MADMAFDDPSMSLGSVRAELLREELGEHGDVDWITLAVAAGIALTFTASSLSAIYGVLPIWLAALVNLAAIYCSQIITHEAVHATILRGGRTFGWLNILLGHIFAGLLFWDFQTMRHLHLRHHRATNEPEIDSDYLPPRSGYGERIVRALLFLPHALVAAASHVLVRDRRPANWRTIICSWLLFYGAAAVIAFMVPLEAIVLWIAPAVVATAAIVLVHWSMHSSEKGRSQFSMTRLVEGVGWRGQLLRLLYLFQNDHLVHHLFPFVPFHRMAEVARRLRGYFLENGVEIVSLARSGGPTGAAGPPR